MLVSLKERTRDSELLDDFKGSKAHLKSVFDDINRVNGLLGGYHITLQEVARMMNDYPQDAYIIVDVGCGDGSMLRELALFCRKQQKSVELIGIDLNETALEIARKTSDGFPEIRYLQQDVLTIDSIALNCDILLTTLTAHHFSNEQLPRMLTQFAKLAKLGVVINDLQRSYLAFYLFKIFSLIFIRSKTAKIDGLISIRRGFKKSELYQFAANLPQMTHEINWKWAFRYVWTMRPKRPKQI